MKQVDNTQGELRISLKWQSWNLNPGFIAPDSKVLYLMWWPLTPIIWQENRTLLYCVYLSQHLIFLRFFSLAIERIIAIQYAPQNGRTSYNLSQNKIQVMMESVLSIDRGFCGVNASKTDAEWERYECHTEWGVTSVGLGRDSIM